MNNNAKVTISNLETLRSSCLELLLNTNKPYNFLVPEFTFGESNSLIYGAIGKVVFHYSLGFRNTSNYISLNSHVISTDFFENCIYILESDGFVWKWNMADDSLQQIHGLPKIVATKLIFFVGEDGSLWKYCKENDNVIKYPISDVTNVFCSDYAISLLFKNGRIAYCPMMSPHYLDTNCLILNEVCSTSNVISVVIREYHKHFLLDDGTLINIEDVVATDVYRIKPHGNGFYIWYSDGHLDLLIDDVIKKNNPSVHRINLSFFPRDFCINTKNQNTLLFLTPDCYLMTYDRERKKELEFLDLKELFPVIVQTTKSAKK